MDSHRTPRAPICCSLQNTISYQRICMSTSDAGTGLGSGRCVLTAAADQTSLLAPLHPHVLVNRLCLKYWSVALPSFSAFPSSSSLITQTFIHVKQTVRSKFSFSHALPERLWGSFTPAEVHGSADASKRAIFLLQGKAVLWQIYSQDTPSCFYPLTSLEETEITSVRRLAVMKMFWLYWCYEINLKKGGI